MTKKKIIISIIIALIWLAVGIVMIVSKGDVKGSIFYFAMALAFGIVPNVMAGKKK